MIAVRAATAADLEAVDGTLPAKTCRALVLEDDNRRLAVFGIYPMNTRYVMFASISDECRANKRGMVTGIRAIKELIASRPPMPLLSQADPAIKNSDVLLKHMGFEQLQGSIYQCPGLKRSPQRSR